MDAILGLAACVWGYAVRCVAAPTSASPGVVTVVYQE